MFSYLKKKSLSNENVQRSNYNNWLEKKKQQIDFEKRRALVCSHFETDFKFVNNVMLI